MRGIVDVSAVREPLVHPSHYTRLTAGISVYVSAEVTADILS